MAEPRDFVVPGIVITIISLLLLVILLPLSFSYVNFDEYAMKQNAITNTLDMSEVYEMGRYFWGVGKSAQKYPRGYQIVDFGGANELSVFDKKGLEVILGSSFQYRIIKDKLPELYRQYGLGYHDQIVNIARALVKNNVSEQYDVEDYFVRRQQLTRNLNELLTAEMPKCAAPIVRGCVEVPAGKFQLRDVTLPVRTAQRFENIAVLSQDNERKRSETTASEVRANTTLDIVKIQGDTLRLQRTGAAQAKSIIQQAEAEAFRLRQEAIAQGYESIFRELSITDGKQKMELVKLMAVHSGTRYIVGADNDVVVNL